MGDALVAGLGVAMMAAGMAAIGWAVYLEMGTVVSVRWWDRPILLAPVGLTALLAGLLLVV